VKGNMMACILLCDAMPNTFGWMKTGAFGLMDEHSIFWLHGCKLKLVVMYCDGLCDGF